MPRWFCVWENVLLERYPTNWGLPRASVVERQCAARGADSCVIDVRWRNPPLGRRFWAPALVGAGAAGADDGRVRRGPCGVVGGRARRRAPAPAPRGGGRLRAGPARAAAAHPADAGSAVRGDPVLEQRAREEVSRPPDDDRAALPAERAGRRRQRDAGRGEDLRADAGAPGPRHGIPGRLSVRRGPGPARRPRSPDGGGCRGRDAVPSRGVLARRPPGGRGPGRRDRSPARRGRRRGARPAHRCAQRPRFRHALRGPGAAQGQGRGVRRALRGVERAGPRRGGGHGAALRRRQPRRPRGGPSRELPDHRGAVPGPGGQGPGADRAARQRERGAAGGLPRSTSDPDAAHPAREDGVDGAARGRGRPRAQQPHRLRLLQRHDARGLRQAAPRHAGGLPGPVRCPRRPAIRSRPSGSAARSTTRSGISTP